MDSSGVLDGSVPRHVALFVNMPNSTGTRPLDLAASLGFNEIMQVLLANGSEQSLVNHKGRTALHMAVFAGNDVGVKILLDAGASPLTVDHEGRSVMHFCSKNDSVKVFWLIQAALKKRRKLDFMQKIDKRKTSPLHMACYHGATAVVQLLLKFGAKLDDVDASGKLPLHWAVTKGCKSPNISLVTTLMSAHDAALKKKQVTLHGVNVQDAEGNTPMHLALVNSKPVANLLAESNAGDCSLADRRGRTSLHLAAQTNAPPNLLEKLMTGQSVTTLRMQDDHGWTALHYAAHGGASKVLNRLITFEKKLANLETHYVDLQDKNQQSAIMLAIGAANYDCVLVLIDHEACLALVNNAGSSTLHIAAATGQVHLCKMLVDHGVYVDALDKAGRTPLYVACENGHHEAMHYLISLAQADPDLIDKSGRTVLHAAAGSGSVESCIELLHMNIYDVNRVAGCGRSVLHDAVLSPAGRQVEVVEILLNEFGSDPNVLDSQGMSPLHLLAASQNVLCQHGLAVAELLLGCKNIEINGLDDKEMSPLDHAIASENTPMVKLLEKAGGRPHKAVRNNARTVAAEYPGTTGSGLKRIKRLNNEIEEQVDKNDLPVMPQFLEPRDGELRSSKQVSRKNIVCDRHAGKGRGNGKSKLKSPDHFEHRRLAGRFPFYPSDFKGTKRSPLPPPTVPGFLLRPIVYPKLKTKTWRPTKHFVGGYGAR